MNTHETKVCKNCGKTLTLDNYFAQKGGKHGVRAICKPCLAVKKEEVIEKYRERVNNYRRNRYANDEVFRERLKEVNKKNYYNKKIPNHEPQELMEGILYEPMHPGEILKGLFIVSRILTKREIAELLMLDKEKVSELFNKIIDVDYSLALRLSKAFKTTVEFWLDLQKKYNEWKDNVRNRE